ncbi:MAG TPA: PAS domain S-box protein [Phenylobacterium sp.]
MADGLITHGGDAEPAGAALLRAVFDATDVMVGVFELLDDDYRYVMVNRNTAAFYGLSEAQMVGRTGREMGVAEADIARRLTTLRHCASTGETVRRQYPFEVAEVGSGWFLGTFSPLPVAGGGPPNIAFVVIDITERRQAQEEAERQRERLSLAIDATGLGLWEYDLARDRVDWDARTRELFGVPDDLPIDYATYAAHVHPDDFPAMREAYQQALNSPPDGRYVVRHRTTARDGTLRWVRGAARVVFDEAGKPLRVLGTTQDITEQVRSTERQELLVAELNHRVKNTLAGVQAIAAHSLRSNPGDPAAFRRAFTERLLSLARGHDLLTRSGWSMASIEDVIREAIAAFGSDRLLLEPATTPVRLKPELAVNLLMVLHELATNAAKYGAFSKPEGHVHIGWTVDAAAGLAITWIERGGPPVSAPSRSGFGARMTATALSAFGGRAETRYGPQGLECRMRVPLGEHLAFGAA